MILIDTSVWIHHFSGKNDFNLANIVEPDRRVLCLPVYQEVLQGIREEAAYRSAKKAFDAGIMVDAPLTKQRYIEAANLYRRARTKGITVRSAVDCLIAVIAIAHNLMILHHDRDYANLAKVSELRQRSI